MKHARRCLIIQNFDQKEFQPKNGVEKQRIELARSLLAPKTFKSFAIYGLKYNEMWKSGFVQSDISLLSK